MKKRIENWLIKHILKNSGLSEKDINITAKTINLGLYSMALHFCEPKHKLILAILCKYHGYKCVEQRFAINNWYMGSEEINKQFKIHNDEYNEREISKLNFN